MADADVSAVATDASASVRIQRAIMAKRSGRALSDRNIETVVGDFVAGRLADHQMAAWLATVACCGLDISEITALTHAYVSSGQRLDLSTIGQVVVDKHSTGGVGDKVTMIVAPLVAACGVAIVKMSGRGLGYAGGTIDKLESIPGLRLDLAPDEILSVVRQSGMVIASQSATLAPGDGATYALRDVTGTVESIPLIAASIMSKKVAVGADCVVLDVKTGAGALIPDRSLGRELAETMVEVGARFGLRCRAVLSDMSQPLGRAVGNALEVKEALAVLRGERLPGISDVCGAIARVMLQSADPALDDAAADAKVSAALASGAAYERFIAWAALQGGDVRTLEDPALMPAAKRTAVIVTDRNGWIQTVDPRAIGMAVVRLGGGRLSYEAALDHAVGVVIARRVGDRVSSGEALAEVHFNNGDAAEATSLVAPAFVVGDKQPSPEPIIHKVFAN